MTNRILRPLLTASAAVLLSTGLAVGAAGAASASTRANQAVNYGEVGQFHCTQPGYSPHYDPAIVDSGNGVGGSVCSA